MYSYSYESYSYESFRISFDFNPRFEGLVELVFTIYNKQIQQSHVSSGNSPSQSADSCDRNNSLVSLQIDAPTLPVMSLL